MDSLEIRSRMIVLAVALGAMAAPALAVNKCVGADGSVTYTDGPCAGGTTQAKRIETPPRLSYREEMEARRRSERVVEDARALEAERLVNDSPAYAANQEKKNEVISDKPDYDIDERVRTEGLSSWINVFDTQSGELIAREQVKQAWITHVQFSPLDSRHVLYNHEWPSDCGIRRMWLWDGERHIRLRHEGDGRSKADWTCHEMWQADGKYIIYHGKYADGRAYVGRVDPNGRDPVEIALPDAYHRYGHFTAGNRHNDWLVTDGYYHPEGVPENSNWG